MDNSIIVGDSVIRSDFVSEHDTENKFLDAYIKPGEVYVVKSTVNTKFGLGIAVEEHPNDLFIARAFKKEIQDV